MISQEAAAKTRTFILERKAIDYTRSLNRTPANLLSRESVRKVKCPTCDVLPGQLCIGTRGIRTANHLSRCYRAIFDLMLMDQTYDTRG